jgi:nucleotide-binding universal stress UspA family protein
MSILAAIDFSPVTRAVLDELSGLVKESEEIILLHVAEPDPSFVGFDAGSDAVQEAWREQFREEEATLDAAADALRDEGLAVRARMVRGAIAEEVLRAATEAEARLIVLGSHGHGVLYNVLVGSAAASVIKNAKIPVTLVPSRKE